MNKNDKKNKPISTFWVVLITALLTLSVTGSGAYFLGFFDQEKNGKIDAGGNRRIAYWRAPMNPTEIYDKPGKSAMGMDLVPVYEDELTGKTPMESDTERKIVYWRAPMNPTEIYDKPGKSAMGMDLVPVYEDELIGGVEIRVDPVIQQNMGVRTSVVEKGPLLHTIRTYGHVTYDETRTAEISPKISGWVERIHIDFIGKFVKKGQSLFELYSPDLFAAQEEYLVTYRNLSRMSGNVNDDLLKAVRQRLRYFDVAESDIKAMEESGKIRKTLAVHSPFDGIVILKNAMEGSYVKAGSTVYRIADLSRIWVEVHIFEYELPWVGEGQKAEMTLPYLPGKKFSGRITYIYPYLQRQTRDVVLRLEFNNPDLVLKPDMYADIKIESSAGEGLMIPSEAVIRSGERNVVFIIRDSNKFTPRNVTLGLSLNDGKVQVIKGLALGETVVTSGQFLLDSESKLKEAVQKMLEAKRARIKAEAPTEEKDEDILKDKESEEDFFQDMEEDEDFFKDMEEEP
jgi:Cu(I)/Ag(I) efflux system membrane fusion protein/cobalt-zinc-cadmium efflux system membrane fusion protein